MTDLPLGSRRHARGLGWPRSGAQPEPRRYTLATTTPSPELIPVTPAFTNTPAAGVSRLPGRSQRPDPPGPTSWTRASTRPGASTTRCAYSPPAAPTPGPGQILANEIGHPRIVAHGLPDGHHLQAREPGACANNAPATSPTDVPPGAPGHAQ